jgi:hypothetical protein
MSTKRWFNRIHPMWLWSHSLLKISSPVPSPYGARWLPGSYTTLHSKCRFAEGLKQEGDAQRSKVCWRVETGGVHEGSRYAEGLKQGDARRIKVCWRVETGECTKDQGLQEDWNTEGWTIDHWRWRCKSQYAMLAELKKKAYKYNETRRVSLSSGMEQRVVQYSSKFFHKYLYWDTENKTVY